MLTARLRLSVDVMAPAFAKLQSLSEELKGRLPVVTDPIIDCPPPINSANESCGWLGLRIRTSDSQSGNALEELNRIVDDLSANFRVFNTEITDSRSIWPTDEEAVRAFESADVILSFQEIHNPDLDWLHED